MPKPATNTTARNLYRVASDAASPRPSPEPASYNRIALEAYNIYVANGCQDGHDVDDWLEAERRVQLPAESTPDAGNAGKTPRSRVARNQGNGQGGATQFEATQAETSSPGMLA